MREALKWLVDYDGIASTIVKGSAVVSTSRSCQRGFLGAIDDNPYTLDVEKAKELLKQAGLEDGFKVTMDTAAPPLPEIAQVLQANWAEAGIELEILPGDNKQTLTKYRARTTTSTSAAGAGLPDPHTTPTPSRPTRTTRTGRPIPASSPGATPGRSRR